MLPTDSKTKHASQQSVCTVTTPKSCETDSIVQNNDWNPPFILICRYSWLDNRKFLWCAKRHSLCWRWTSRQSPPVSSGCVALSWSKFFGRICINIFISITITVLIVIIMIMIFILKGTLPLKLDIFFLFQSNSFGLKWPCGNFHVFWGQIVPTYRYLQVVQMGRGLR